MVRCTLLNVEEGHQLESVDEAHWCLSGQWTQLSQI